MDNDRLIQAARRARAVLRDSPHSWEQEVFEELEAALTEVDANQSKVGSLKLSPLALSSRQAARAVRELREVLLGKMVHNVLWDGDHHHVEVRTKDSRIVFEAQAGPAGSVRLAWEIEEVAHGTPGETED